MHTTPHQVLFVCTGNSVRSILAEAQMTHLGGGRFKAWSAGGHRSRAVHPRALATLRQLHVPVDGLRSKGWGEFAAPDAPVPDFVLTLCDNAAGEVCPRWPGQPMTAHWGVSDPSTLRGGDAQTASACLDTAILLQRRIALLLALPIDTLARRSLQAELNRSCTTGA